MSQLPFDLPKSLVSYADQFQQDPDKAIQRLEAQAKKRGPDAVGYFLLAWLHHLQGNNEEAIIQALKAKTYAPGSPFLEKLHYYLVHPHRFEAWKPQRTHGGYSKSESQSIEAGPILNLDALIERLADAESERIKIPADQSTAPAAEGAPNIDGSDDIASDTLANIHETQGKTEAAIRTYQRLKKLNKEKKEFYQQKIDELKKKQLVATTMAKVCTSELFYNISYDAVVVDEGSMAGIPYLLLMAAKSKEHLIIAGDPMQLPPIAITNDREAREFLEQDIFTYVSKSDTTEALFNWHDENPEFTCFFDVQYRLKDDLAGVISSVFYEGRLKSDQSEKEIKSLPDSSGSVALVNTAKYQPYLEQETGERGFKPVNEVHHKLIEESLKRLTRNYAPENIGIIVPFRNSVYKVRNHLWEKGFKDIEVGTIHTFQGREKSVIIFDTVMSGEWQNGSMRHYSVRPFDEKKNGLSVPRLLNVAFSRSKELLVIIADMQHIERVYGKKFLGRLLNSVSEISI